MSPVTRCRVCHRPAELAELLLVTARDDPRMRYLVHRPDAQGRCFSYGVGQRDRWAIQPAVEGRP